MKNWIRSPVNQLGKLANIILTPIFLCALYKDMGSEQPPQPALPSDQQEYVQMYMSCIFINLFCSIGMPLYDTVLIFPIEREVFFKEASGKLYSTYSYFFTRYVIEIPGLIVPPLAVCAIIYYIIGLNEASTALIIFFASHCLMSLAGGNLGLILGIVFSNSTTAIGLLPLILIPILLFGGLIAKLSTIPDYASWLQYLSPARYAFSAIMLSQFEGKSF